MILKYFVEKFETIDDMYRAEVLRQLEREMRKTPMKVQVCISDYIIQRRKTKDELLCYEVRLMRKPMPYYPKYPEQYESSISHLATCPSCIQWDMDGRPYEYDFTWEFARKCLCGLMKETLAHKQDWPQSYIEALKHSQYCAICNERRNIVIDSRDCVKVRTYLLGDRLRGTYDYTYREAKILMDAHVENCDKCQAWCNANTTCEETRKMITGTVLYNKNGKPESWAILAPIELHHISRCSGCLNWIQSEYNEDEYNSVLDLLNQIEHQKDLINQAKPNPHVLCVDQDIPDYDFISKSESGKFDLLYEIADDKILNIQRRRRQISSMRFSKIYTQGGVEE